MNKKEIRKEFNEFLDSASEETIIDFLKFLKERKEKKKGSKEDRGTVASFKSSLN